MKKKNPDKIDYIALGKKFLEDAQPELQARKDGQIFISNKKDIAEAMDLAEAALQKLKSSTQSQRIVFIQTIIKTVEKLQKSICKIAAQEYKQPVKKMSEALHIVLSQARMVVTCHNKFKEQIGHDSPIITRMIKRENEILKVLPCQGPVAYFINKAPSFPFQIINKEVLFHFADGNTIAAIGEPSSRHSDALLCYAIKEAAHKTNMPEGVFTLWQGMDLAKIKQLIAQPKLGAISFSSAYDFGYMLFVTHEATLKEVPFSFIMDDNMETLLSILMEEEE
ncbi:MAG TPA: aldehyde dehydrogenase family protein [Phaeodactylibacter sp.]|nr:aldehyde dehydrogenase family protein [Phaeodactylibacter sp.]